MTDKYDLIFDAYKKYIETNSKYSARVVKYNTSTSTYFPLITFTLSNNVDLDNNSLYIELAVLFNILYLLQAYVLKSLLLYTSLKFDFLTICHKLRLIIL